MRKSIFAVFAILTIVSMLAACAPAATPVPTAAPVIQTKIVEATKVVMATQIVQITNTPAPDRVQVTWYIGLGAGSTPEAIPLEKAFVDKYNKSQSEIQLIPIIVANAFAPANLTTQIAGGNAPDIVGPLGTSGRMGFPGAWLDLQPLVQQFKYDTSDIDPQFMNFYKDEGVLVGLPFAIFPMFVYANKDLFKEAGLALPPQKVGDKYTLDGQQVDWTWDTLATIAKKLTVDKNGNDATSAKFDKNNIVQYGWVPQWTDAARPIATLFGAYPQFVDGKANWPDSAKAALKFYYDAMWGPQPFAPNDAVMAGDLMKGNAFSSGKVAMGTTHLWYTCCIDSKNVPNWDTAVMPSYNGKITSLMHGDTFAIMAASKNPTAAFKVYTYLLGDGATDLYTIYGGLPARKSQQAAFFASLDKKFAPNKANWQVALDMIPYMDVPNHENIVSPNYIKIYNTDIQEMATKLKTDPKLDFNKFIADYTKILTDDYNAKPAQ